MIAAQGGSDSLWEVLGSAGIFTASAAILVVLLKFAMDASAGLNQRRRERYAELVAALVAWAELPFRVRRRVSDEPAVRAELAAQVHQLQERLVLGGAELAAECTWLSKRFDASLATIKFATAPFLAEAWQLSPIDSAEGMNLAGWGPVGSEDIVRAWRSELRWRFGWRRSVNPIRLLVQRLVRPSASEGETVGQAEM
jgi:hypothetical protein